MNTAIRSLSAGLVLGALPLLACATTPVGTQSGRLEQANASPGRAVYQRACAGCHGQSGEGVGSAPPVMGKAALQAYERKTAEELHKYVSREMPLPKAKAGSLSPEQYWAVVNFMLLAHGSDVPEGGVNEQNAASVAVKPPN
jgi:mono/diheme cytochrome c family protein